MISVRVESTETFVLRNLIAKRMHGKKTARFFSGIKAQCFAVNSFWSTNKQNPQHYHWISNKPTNNDGYTTALHSSNSYSFHKFIFVLSRSHVHSSIQLVLMAISYQVLVNPAAADSIEAVDLSTRDVLPSAPYNYEHLEQLLSNEDNYEDLRRHILKKLSKRRAQAKANLAGLWGVPTRFAWMSNTSPKTKTTIRMNDLLRSLALSLSLFFASNKIFHLERWLNIRFYSCVYLTLEETHWSRRMGTIAKRMCCLRGIDLT